MILLNFRVMMCFAFSILTLDFVLLKIDLIVEQRLEAAQMKFLRKLLGIIKLNKEKNQCIRGKTERRT